jgi:hypothetical protein
VKQLGDIPDPQDAAAAKGSVIDFVSSGHGAGMRRRGTRSCFRAPGLNDDDRFAE